MFFPFNALHLFRLFQTYDDYNALAPPISGYSPRAGRGGYPY